MFNSGYLKQNAKVVMNSNYWKTVLVTFLYTLICGYSAAFVLNFGEFDTASLYISNSYSDNAKGALGILGFLGILFIVIFVLDIFVIEPLQVGFCKWYLENRKSSRDERLEKPSFSLIGYAFKNGYSNTVKVMLKKEIFILLWSCLFIIPGVVKRYEYMMIPYLLAENPKMESQEAFHRSKEMMMGFKGSAFYLDLSFIPWMVLSSFTCSLLSLFYVTPYMMTTYAEFYVSRCEGDMYYSGFMN